jgi:coenzyme F420-reducing hydrogenase delta subunit/Pyruvate/2-oxoacid:ferredoxin oxidoreductase delta subunit
MATVREHCLEAVVLAGGAPSRYEEVLFGSRILDDLHGAGVNPNRVVFANLLDLVALVHATDPLSAAAKARLLLDVALARAELAPATESISVRPWRAVLVAGTSPAGIVAAATLLGEGYHVTVLEPHGEPRVPAEDWPQIGAAWTAVRLARRARILTESRLVDVSGHVGDFKVVAVTPSGEERFTVGGIILAPGEDMEWIAELRGKLRFATDCFGQAITSSSRLGGCTERGVCIVQPRGGDRLALEVAGANAAVLSLTTLLDREEIDYPLLVTHVDEEVCGGCGTCVKTCAFSASQIDPARRISVIDAQRCKGCGNCVTACPTGARDLAHDPSAYVFKAIDVLSRGIPGSRDPKILGIFCSACGEAALRVAATCETELDYPPSMLPLVLTCGGAVDTEYVLKALASGFDGVALFVCADGHCRNSVGNTDMIRRMGVLREVLRSRRIDDGRLRVFQVCPNEGDVVRRDLHELIGELRAEAGR